MHLFEITHEVGTTHIQHRDTAITRLNRPRADSMKLFKNSNVEAFIIFVLRALPFCIFHYTLLVRVLDERLQQRRELRQGQGDAHPGGDGGQVDGDAPEEGLLVL